MNQQTSKANIKSWGTEMCPGEEKKSQESDWGLVMQCCGRHAERFDFPVGKWVKYSLIYKDDWNLCLKDIWKGKKFIASGSNLLRFKQEEIATLHVRDDEELGLQSYIVRARKK